MTTVQKIKGVPINKATSFHLGQLKRRGGGGGGLGFDVARTGIASVGFVGFPSLERCAALRRRRYVSEIDFTTLTTVPGTLKVHGALFKYWTCVSAGIIEGAAEGRGRGKQVARTCNLIFIVLDVLKPLGDKKIIESELEGFGIRKEKGGIAITNTVPLTNIDQDEIRAILSEYRINNADVAIREPNATADDLVDVIEGNRRVMTDEQYRNNLMEKMWETLDLVRVYTKPRGLAPDYTQPVVLRRGKCTVEDFCNAIHKEIAKQLKYAVVWGVGLEHVLEDEDGKNYHYQYHPANHFPVVHIAKK
ncbi:P-loop containing nucleoside triphosphate hydrolase protein [Salix suchowensis]|nr:P-loop containing nucleoside triphosphate hydrolase protein [Salix suchowensis]